MELAEKSNLMIITQGKLFMEHLEHFQIFLESILITLMEEVKLTLIYMGKLVLGNIKHLTLTSLFLAMESE